ncbi:MAG: hypothetical protein RIT25_2863 [Planctomycetota bacterium]|jgi:hypothetical protein
MTKLRAMRRWLLVPLLLGLGGCGILADELTFLDVAPAPPRGAPAGTDARP